MSRDLARVSLRSIALEKIAGALLPAGIRWAALKGTDLAHRAYPAATARDMSDIDILVDPYRIEDASRALVAGGLLEEPCEAAHHRSFRVPLSSDGRASLIVEVHTDLFDRPHGLSVDPSKLLDRATSVALPEGGSLPVLAAADAWVHVAAHLAFSDAGSGPVRRQLTDLRLLGRATKLEIAELLVVADAWGTTESIALVLSTIEAEGEALDDPLLAAFAARARNNLRLRSLLARPMLRRRIARSLRGEPAPGPATTVRSLLTPDLFAAARMLWEGLARRHRRKAQRRRKARAA